MLNTKTIGRWVVGEEKSKKASILEEDGVSSRNFADAHRLNAFEFARLQSRAIIVGCGSNNYKRISFIMRMVPYRLGL